MCAHPIKEVQLKSISTYLYPVFQDPTPWRMEVANLAAHHKSFVAREETKLSLDHVGWWAREGELKDDKR